MARGNGLWRLGGGLPDGDVCARGPTSAVRIGLCARRCVVQRVRRRDRRLALWSRGGYLVRGCIAEVSNGARSTERRLKLIREPFERHVASFRSSGRRRRVLITL